MLTHVSCTCFCAVCIRTLQTAAAPLEPTPSTTQTFPDATLETLTGQHRPWLASTCSHCYATLVLHWSTICIYCAKHELKRGSC